MFRTQVALLFAFALFFAITQPSVAALIHHYSFNNGANLGEDSVGTRDMPEETVGVGGTITQEASVSDVNGTIRTDVLRIADRVPLTAIGGSNTTAGSFLSHDTGGSSVLANYTVALWIRTSTVPHADFTGVFSNGPNSATNNFQIETGEASNPDYLRLLGQSGVSITDGDDGGETGLITNDWTHLSVTYDGTTTSFYIDGQEFGSSAANAGNDFGEMRIGSNRGENRLFDGDIDDVGIWNNSESAVDIALIHGLGLFEGLDLDSSELDDVQNAFLSGEGSSAVAGANIWYYGDGFATGSLGLTGGSVLGGDAFIILDNLGNGVTLTAPVPEPSTFLILGLGALSLFRYIRRPASHRA